MNNSSPLSQLDKPVQFLKGVGPRRAESLGRMGIVRARDLLYHVPRRFEDASTVSPIAEAEVGSDVTLIGEIRTKGIVPTRSRLKIFQAVLQDESGLITVAWPGQPWVDRKLNVGDQILVTGPVKFFHGRQLQPREYTLLARAGQERMGADAEGTIFVAYPASEEVPQWVFRGIFERNLEWLIKHVEDEEYLSEGDLESLGLPGLADALFQFHSPETLAGVESARRRLAFDELFFLQLLHAQARYRQTKETPGIRFKRTNDLIRAVVERLPFSLTDAQARVLREIAADMTSERRMSRMLQGDVGSGKTLVALFAMLIAIEGGYQAALMAPTEILAEQHARTIKGYLEGTAVRSALVVGGGTEAERRTVRTAIAAGETHLAIGTHALIQESVSFPKLGLVVVDEQHRFGVRQRLHLADRVPVPDVLIMSATPIPRSLAMTLHGDLDLSILDELPPGRTPIATSVVAPSKRGRMYGAVRDALEAGRQVYFVYPLVEESEKVDLLSATEEFERLSKEEFPDHVVGLLHGRMSAEEKEGIMRDFSSGIIHALVATTVIEVGIDVPNATVMVIEHAERFGLSQLHQLRGRVGRGTFPGQCFLVSDPGDEAGERLKVFSRTTDGFEIAQEDLRIRGQGDLFGARQHGRGGGFRFADVLEDQDLLGTAQTWARGTIDTDPHLEESQNGQIRALLERQYGDRIRLFGVG